MLVVKRRGTNNWWSKGSKSWGPVTMVVMPRLCHLIFSQYFTFTVSDTEVQVVRIQTGGALSTRTGITWEEVEVAAQDRSEWHRSVAQCIHLDAD